MKNYTFMIVNRDPKTSARTGVIHTSHGDIETPAFVPVGTQATVKSLTPDELDTLGVQLYFVNTYHMYLRPGVEVVKKSGGLHTFMHWDKPLITDSGGFQVFSLGRESSPGRRAFSSSATQDMDGKKPISSLLGGDAETSMPTSGDKGDKILSTPRVSGSLVKISDDGVEFRSHWDGSKHIFTPESSMAWQWDLGADIHIAFDDCTPYPVTHDAARASMERTHRWAKRSIAANAKCRMLNDKLHKPYQALYGSIQGSVFEDLRKESAAYISSMDFDGFAIGGVSVGESKKQMCDVLSWVTPSLPPDKPRHLLGVGEIDDIFALVEAGVDTFDCVQPTRLARVGILLVENNPINKSSNNPIKKYELDITKSACAEDLNPIDKGCRCYTCTHFSRAYVHHLFHVRELLGYRLATIHNLFFVHTLVGRIRESIANGSFLELKRQWL